MAAQFTAFMPRHSEAGLTQDNEVEADNEDSDQDESGSDSNEDEDDEEFSDDDEVDSEARPTSSMSRATVATNLTQKE